MRKIYSKNIKKSQFEPQFYNTTTKVMKDVPIERENEEFLVDITVTVDTDSLEREGEVYPDEIQLSTSNWRRETGEPYTEIENGQEVDPELTDSEERKIKEIISEDPINVLGI